MNKKIIFSDLDDLLEVLVTISEMEKLRHLINADKKAINLISDLFDKITNNFKRYPSFVSNYLIYTSNLCYQESNLRKILFENANMK